MVLVHKTLTEAQIASLKQKKEKNASISDEELVREVDKFWVKLVEESHKWAEAMNAGCCAQHWAAAYLMDVRLTACTLYHLLAELEMREGMYEVLDLPNIRIEGDKMTSSKLREYRMHLSNECVCFLRHLIGLGFLANNWLVAS
ncbi:MAG: hypothetical protein LBH96_04745 [Candidatus Peribacteria bacterium]|jgi:hypothetical protein|nr:hypothetical protein [Candidatus Peribacteria bacterium]